MAYYERNLPHWRPEGTPLFLTWCLHGAHANWKREQSKAATDGRAFVLIDRALDQAALGPKCLLEPPIAECVVEALHFGARELKFYELLAFCVMPNHVHVVLNPTVPVPRLTKSVKGFTARTANLLLGRTGEPFWQDESYDHWVRNSDELSRIIKYVERNPVSAGLVDSPEKWRWSSAHRLESLCNKNTGRNACAT